MRDIHLRNKLLWVLVIIYLGLLSFSLEGKFLVGSIETSLIEILAGVVFISMILSDEARSSSLWKPFLFLLFCSFISMLIGFGRGNPIQAVLRDTSWIAFVAFFFVGQLLAKNLRVTHRSIKFLVVISVLIGVYGTLFYTNTSSEWDIGFKFRLIGAFSLLWIFEKFLSQKHGLLQKVAIFFPAIIVLVVFVIGLRTRALYLGVGSASLILVMIDFIRKRGIEKLLTFLLVSVISGLLLYLLISTDIFAKQRDYFVGRINTLRTYEQDVTARARLLLWTDTWETLKSDPILLLFGQGAGSYMWVNVTPSLALGEWRFTSGHMLHNEYFAFLHIGGILLLLGVTSFLGFILKKLLLGILNPSSLNETFGYNVVFLSYFFCILIYMTFGTALFSWYSATWIWLMLGVGVEICEQDYLSIRKTANGYSGIKRKRKDQIIPKVTC